MISIDMSPSRGKRDCVIGHILKRENGHWLKKIAFLCHRFVWHPAWLGKVGVNMNFRPFRA